MKKVLTAIVILSICISCMERDNKKQDIENEFNKNIQDVTVVDSIESPPSLTSKKKDSLVLVFQEGRGIEDYKSNIHEFSKLTNINARVIESVIPISEEEYIYFYLLSYSENRKDVDLFRSISKHMRECAMENERNCLKLFLNISNFVDGEYADLFFINVATIIENHPRIFCDIYDELKPENKTLLKDFFDESCGQE